MQKDSKHFKKNINAIGFPLIPLSTLMMQTDVRMPTYYQGILTLSSHVNLDDAMLLIMTATTEYSLNT